MELKTNEQQVDQIFYAAALAANQARLPLAKMAVTETRMGVVEDKVIKASSFSCFLVAGRVGCAMARADCSLRDLHCWVEAEAW